MNYLEDLWNIVCWFHSQSLWFRRSWVEPENLRFYKVPQWPPFENGGFKWVLISEWGRIECSGTEKAIAGVLKLLPCIPTTSDFFLCPILASQPLVCLSVDGLRTGATATGKKGDGTHSHMAMEVRKWNKHYLLSEVTHVLVFSLGLFLFLQSSLFSSLKWSGRGLFTTRSLVPDSRLNACNATDSLKGLHNSGFSIHDRFSQRSEFQKGVCDGVPLSAVTANQRLLLGL